MITASKNEGDSTDSVDNLKASYLFFQKSKTGIFFALRGGQTKPLKNAIASNSLDFPLAFAP